MYKFLSKNGETVAFGVGFLLIAVYLVIVFFGVDGFDTLPKAEKFTKNIFNFGLQASIVLIIIGIIAALAFGLYQMATNIKGSVKLLAALAAIIVIYFVASGVLGADMNGPLNFTLTKFEINEAVSAHIGGALMTALVLFVIAFLTFIVFEILNFFK